MTANGTVDGHLTNGEKPQSLTLQHLTSYPVISDSIKFYEDNRYGAKSISLAQEAYIRLVLPVEPYLKTPISYVAPYLAKADSLGDEGLKKVDEKFPIVKEETASLKEKAQGVASLPLKYATDSKEYIIGTYQDEYKRTGGQGVVTTIKAILSTELKVTQDVLQYIADALQVKKQEAKKAVDEKANN